MHTDKSGNTARMDDDILTFLMNSPNREAILRCLHEHACDTREIKDRLRKSRSTIQQNVRALEVNGLVEKVDGRYRVTTLGRTLTEEIANCRHRIKTTEKLAPFLEYVPQDIEIEIGALSDCTVVTAKQSRPHEPTRHFLSLIRESEVISGLFPVIPPAFVEIFHQQVADGNLSVRVITEPVVGEMLVEAYPEKLEELCAHPGFEAWITQNQVSHGVAVIDQTAIALFAFDDAGTMQTIVECTDSEAYAWVIKEYEALDETPSQRSLSKLTESQTMG